MIKNGLKRKVSTPENDTFESRKKEVKRGKKNYTNGECSEDIVKEFITLIGGKQTRLKG